VTARRAPAKAAERPLPGGMPRIVQALAAHFQRLPGVGERTSQRFAMHMATGDAAYAKGLAVILDALHDKIVPCPRCNGLAECVEGEAPPHLCGVCRDSKRDDGLLCVVAHQADLMVVEKTGAMRGRYFVLGRLVSPLDGVGIEELPVDGLLRAISRATGGVEVLLALPVTVEGEATAMAIQRELASVPGVRVTAIARGVPHGGELEFADAVTLTRAITGRAEVKQP